MDKIIPGLLGGIMMVICYLAFWVGYLCAQNEEKRLRSQMRNNFVFCMDCPSPHDCGECKKLNNFEMRLWSVENRLIYAETRLLEEEYKGSDAAVLQYWAGYRDALSRVVRGEEDEH